MIFLYRSFLGWLIEVSLSVFHNMSVNNVYSARTKTSLLLCHESESYEDYPHEEVMIHEASVSLTD